MTFGFPFRLLSFVLAGSFLAVAASLAQPAPPVAPIRNVVDVYFGTKVTDPYRWMEDTKNPEFQAWMKSQNDYTRAVLESIPGREPLFDSIAQYDNGRVRILGLQKYGGRYFYRKLEPDQDNYKVYLRDISTGAERLLIDPDRLRPANETAHYALDYFYASPDGKYVAYGVSAGGSENSTLRVFDVDANRDLPEAIERAQYPRVSWRADSRSFFYNRLQKTGPNDPPTARYLNSQLCLHRIGEEAEKDLLVADRLHAPAVSLVESDTSP